MDRTDTIAVKNLSAPDPSTQAERDILVTEGILFWIRIHFIKTYQLKRSGHGCNKTSADPKIPLAISGMLNRLRRMHFESPVLQSAIWKEQSWAYYRQTFHLFEITHQG